MKIKHMKYFNNEQKGKGNIFDSVVNQIGMAWLQFIQSALYHSVLLLAFDSIVIAN